MDDLLSKRQVEDLFEIRKKICLLGEAGVGKTSLIGKFVLDSFDEKHLSTMGAKVSKKKVSVPTVEKSGKKVDTFVTLAIWDVIGQQEYHSLVQKYFKDSDGGLVVADASRVGTIKQIRNWIISFNKVVGNVPIMLMINKSDLIDINSFDVKPIEDLCSEFGTTYFFTSAKTGDNVESSFTNLAESIVKTTVDDKKITSLIEVADAIIVDFCTVLGGFEVGMPMVDQQFKKAGVNFLDPTKEQLLAALQNLVAICQEIQGPDVAKRERNKFLKILNKF